DPVWLPWGVRLRGLPRGERRDVLENHLRGGFVAAGPRRERHHHVHAGPWQDEAGNADHLIHFDAHGAHALGNADRQPTPGPLVGQLAVEQGLVGANECDHATPHGRLHRSEVAGRRRVPRPSRHPYVRGAHNRTDGEVPGSDDHGSTLGLRGDERLLIAQVPEREIGREAARRHGQEEHDPHSVLSHDPCASARRGAPLFRPQRGYSFLIVKAVASEIAARCDVQPMSGRRNTNLYGNRIVTVAGVPVPDRHPVMLTVALLGFSPARPSAFRMVAKTESCDTPGSATTAMRAPPRAASVITW